MPVGEIPVALAWAHPLVAEWFLGRFGSPTEPQEQGWFPGIIARFWEPVKDSFRFEQRPPGCRVALQLRWPRVALQLN